MGNMLLLNEEDASVGSKAAEFWTENDWFGDFSPPRLRTIVSSGLVSAQKPGLAPMLILLIFLEGSGNLEEERNIHSMVK